MSATPVNRGTTKAPTDIRTNCRPLQFCTYQSWRDNPVTRQLLFDTAEQVLDALIDPLPAAGISDIGGVAVAREMAIDTASNIIHWKPAELEGEDEA